MKKLVVELIACLIMISCAAGVSFAQTSASVTVSFTIPVMPGLNAPLIEKEEIKAEPQKLSEEKEAAPTQETALQEPQLIQQDAQDEKVIVKTFYSR